MRAGLQPTLELRSTMGATPGIARVITDSQIHLWEAHRPDRPWPVEERGKPFVAVPGARPHRVEPLGADEMLALMDGAGVDRAVVVPPSPIGDSNLTALEAAARHPQRFAVMGRLDPFADDAASQLACWREQPGMLGIRMTFHKPKWSAWLDDGIEWFWRDCARHGLPIMLLAPGRMEAIGKIARKHPRLVLIVDHMGRRSDLRDDACFADLDLLLRLAELPNVVVKASAVPCYSTEPYPFRNLDPYVEGIVEAFGPERTMWGSDVSRLPCSYRESVRHFRAELRFLRGDDLEWVMGKAAARWLRWPQESATVTRSTPHEMPT
jgi:predicted TIM-barrel fold metal-dependent hydrolase